MLSLCERIFYLKRMTLWMGKPQEHLLSTAFSHKMQTLPIEGQAPVVERLIKITRG